MRIKKISLSRILFAAIVVTHLVYAVAGFAQDKGRLRPFRDGVYINLTEDFYRALRDEGNRQSTTYSTEKSNEYLRQIAVSTKFAVETNLQIIKQQEQIIRLLESIDKKRK